MRKIITGLATIVLVLTIAGCASTPTTADSTAASGKAVKVTNLNYVPSHGTVIVSGKVDEIFDSHMFVLRDKHSSVEIVSKTKPLDVYYGEEISVTGVVKRSMLQSLLGDRVDIQAKSITLPDGKVINF